MLSIIVAISENYAIGKNNDLLCRISADLKRFKALTTGHTVIMGRKTFESMPYKALEDRNPIVLSRKKIDSFCDISSFSDIIELLKYVEATPNEEFVVVGGAQIYEDMMPFVDTMYLTEINDYAEADTFFPNIDIDEWDIERIYSII